MAAQHFVYRSRFDHAASEVFAWHARPGALERLLPPWTGASVEARSGQVPRDGSTVVLRLPAGPLGMRWKARHHDYAEGSSFSDSQESGPFASWTHVHRVVPCERGCELVDSIEYNLPLAPVSHLVAAPFVRSMLEKTFAWRHRRTRDDLGAHARAGLLPQRIAVTGATGLVGRELCAFLGTGGHDVRPVLRRPTGAAGEIAWDPARGAIDLAALEGMDAVVHLAGESIASSRWSDASKQRVLASRVEGTRLLAGALARLERKPRVLVSASAIGFYGDRGDETLDEGAAPGQGFLADTCRAWEESTRAAEEAGIRVVHLRIGVVLTPAGGALAQMLPPFRAGVAGPLGDGRQWMSWISLDDVLGAVLHAMATPTLSGAVNATAPSPATNASFTRALARTLGRPAFLRVPAFALRAAVGEMADALLLASTRVLPGCLAASGFVFRDAELDEALAWMLGRSPAAQG